MNASNAGSTSCCSISRDRKSTRLNSSHSQISYAVFCLKKKTGTHLAFVLEGDGYALVDLEADNPATDRVNAMMAATWFAGPVAVCRGGAPALMAFVSSP